MVTKGGRVSWEEGSGMVINFEACIVCLCAVIKELVAVLFENMSGLREQIGGSPSASPLGAGNG